MAREKQSDQNMAESSTSSAQRLDPALFAASFSKPAFANSTSVSLDDEVKSEKEKTHKKAKRKSEVFKDKDGQSIRRLKDGRTTVRVLQKRKLNDLSDERIEDVISRPEALDSSQSLPTARAKKFKKEKLGLKGTQATMSSTSRALKPKSDDRKSKSKKKSAEDPLGLEDPAFEKGGEMAHLGLSVLGNKGSKKKSNESGKRKSMSTLRRGDAGRGGPAPSKNGIATNFVRSG